MTTVERTTTRAPILSVFASIQGEGAFVGEPQVFVRLAGCPLRCRWCDTPASWHLDGSPERVLGLDVARRVAEVEGDRPRTVSITGGEPLLWSRFVLELAAELRPRRVHLETAGAHPVALGRVIDEVDHVSLDLKLPADLDAPEELAGVTDELAPVDADDWREVRRHALGLIAGRDACGKLILAAGRTPADFAPLLDDVGDLAADLPLVIQPVSPINGVAAPGRAELEALVDDVLARGFALRVLPQVHRTLRLP